MERHQERPNPGIDRCVRSGGVLCLPAAGWYWLWVSRVIYTPSSAVRVARRASLSGGLCMIGLAGWLAGAWCWKGKGWCVVVCIAVQERFVCSVIFVSVGLCGGGW